MNDEIRTNKLELVDEAGRTCAKLGFAKFADDAPSLWLKNKARNMASLIGFFGVDQLRLGISSPEGQVDIACREQSAEIDLAGHRRGRLILGCRDEARVVLQDKSRITRMTLLGRKTAAVLVFHDSNGIPARHFTGRGLFKV